MLAMTLCAKSLIGLRRHELCLHVGSHANVLSDVRLKVWSRS